MTTETNRALVARLEQALGLNWQYYVLGDERVLAALVPLPVEDVAGVVKPDMRKVVEALGFEPDNHHNALKCPYCNPDGLASPTQGADVGRLVEACREFQCFVLLRPPLGTPARAAWDEITQALAAFRSGGEK